MEPTTDQVIVADDTRDPYAHQTAFEFGLDGQFGAETGTLDILNGFRLAFWVKDHFVGKWESGPQVTHPLLFGVARTVELLFLDIPLAAEITVFPHEIFGHGARIRELGGSPRYHFEPPPPYSFSPSTTGNDAPLTHDTPDANLLITQAGIVTEAYAAHAALLSSFESDTLNHVDSGLIVGEAIHEVFEATLPFGTTGDVGHWTNLQAFRYGVRAEGIQQRYLVATSIANLVNPTFLYSTYDVFWRFVVLGRRTGSMPSLRVGEASLWFNTHVSPVPWGLEYELDLLGRWKGAVLELAPRWGQGPGGLSAGVDVNLRGVRVLPELVVGGGVSAWIQPELDLEGDVGLGFLGRLRDPSGPDWLNQPEQPGARFHIEARWEQPGWFLGARVGGKSEGISGLQPIAPSAETVALVGLLLGRP